MSGKNKGRTASAAGLHVKPEASKAARQQEEDDKAAVAAAVGAAKIPQWKLAFSNMDAWQLPVGIKFMKDRMETCNYISADEGGDTAITFKSPPGMVQFCSLAGIGRANYTTKVNSKDNTFAIQLVFGLLPPSIIEKAPHLLQEHREFMALMKEARDRIAAKLVADKTSRTDMKAASFAMAERLFKAEKPTKSWPLGHTLLTRAQMFQALQKGGVADPEKMIEASHYYEEGVKCDQTVTKAIYDIVKKQEDAARHAHLLNEVVKELAPKMSGFPDFDTDADGNEYMVLKMNSKAMYKPVKKPKVLGDPNPPTGDFLRDEMERLVGPAGEFVLQDVWYRDARGNRLFEKERKENPMAEMLNKGDLISVAWKVRAYSAKDKDGRWGVKLEPEWRSIVVHAQPPKEETEALLPKSNFEADDYDLGDSSAFTAANRVSGTVKREFGALGDASASAHDDEDDGYGGFS